MPARVRAQKSIDKKATKKKAPKKETKKKKAKKDPNKPKRASRAPSTKCSNAHRA